MTLLKRYPDRKVMNKVVVTFSEADIKPNVLFLRPNINLITGVSNFQSEFGTPTSLEEDLLVLSSAIFASDLALKRAERENITRSIELNIPVVNHHLFESVLKELRFALYKLSHDSVVINFIKRAGTIENYKVTTVKKNAKVLLFSGGLDSMSAAVQFGRAGDNVELVSHITGNQVISRTQNNLFRFLQDEFKNQFNHTSFRVGGRTNPKKGFLFPSDSEREETQRTRSFLFLTLASIVARRRGIKDVIFIAENGQLAINLPLTASRISSFSTHTAHPEFLYVMGKILSKLLDFQLEIHNPFLYLTKAEVVKSLIGYKTAIIKRTISCWQASRVTGQYNHCGYCVPCLIRRIAIENNGIRLNEYKRDILNEDLSRIEPQDEGLKNIKELCLFIKLLSQTKSQANLEDEYPDLINPHFNAVKAATMYKKFAKEALDVFGNYPGIKSLMG